MRILLQRVREAWVDIRGCSTPKIAPGLLALVGFQQEDRSDLLEPMASKMVNLRIFDDDQGRMNLSLLDAGGGLAVVSQFTLYADARRGRRPGFSRALEPGKAAVLFEEFGSICRGWVPSAIMGEFGAGMQVHLVNDGPVTILLDSTELGLQEPRAGNS